jgi:hypothetical protein
LFAPRGNLDDRSPNSVVLSLPIPCLRPCTYLGLPGQPLIVIGWMT